MHGSINVKSLNNTSKWQMGFNSAFKGLIICWLYVVYKDIFSVPHLSRPTLMPTQPPAQKVPSLLLRGKLTTYLHQTPRLTTSIAAPFTPPQRLHSMCTGWRHRVPFTDYPRDPIQFKTNLWNYGSLVNILRDSLCEASGSIAGSLSTYQEKLNT
jgi:hypothetical protein